MDPNDYVLGYIATLALGVLLIVYRYLYTTYHHAGLNRYPGPFVAKYTNIWRARSVCSNKHHEEMQKLHLRYGSVVRTGPNSLSIGDPKYVPLIYGVNNGFTKSSFYDPFSPQFNGKVLTSLLSERDEKLYAAMKRPIASAYSLGTLFQYEPLVDTMINRLVEKLSEASEKVTVCDMALWIRCYAWDVILNLTFGSSLGFLDQGGDVENLMSTLDGHLDVIAWMTQMPWISNNPIYNAIIAIISYFKPSATLLQSFTQKHIKEHIQHPAWSTGTGHDSGKPNRIMDFTDRFIVAAHSTSDSTMKIDKVFNWSFGNFIAGGDTIAVTLSATFYYLLKNPDVYRKLMKELGDADLQRVVHKRPISWKESGQLPFLDAIIKETLRLHPSVGLGLERTVPAHGMEMDDSYRIPAGVQVSINAWVTNRDEKTFGEDAKLFNPERWVQKDGEDAQMWNTRISKMSRADLSFGSGSRSCLGKNIAMLEMRKVLPTLLLNFNFEPATQDLRWNIKNRWIVKPQDINCTIRRRF